MDANCTMNHDIVPKSIDRLQRAQNVSAQHKKLLICKIRKIRKICKICNLQNMQNMSEMQNIPNMHTKYANAQYVQTLFWYIKSSTLLCALSSWYRVSRKQARRHHP
jgi:hypothetical protein